MCSGGCLVVCCASAKGRQQGGTDQHTTRSCSTHILLLPLPAVIYVAEAAQTLSRNADYEAPFFKKQAAKFQQQLSDLERRKADAHKSAAAAAAEFEQVWWVVRMSHCGVVPHIVHAASSCRSGSVW
jgi:hypothetical protein